MEKETGEKYQKIRDKIGYQDFLDNQSFLGKRGKIFSKNNQYLKYVSPNPQISLKIKTTLKVNQDKYYSKIEKTSKKINSNIKTIHYVAPQVWVWRENRVKKFKNFVDHILLLFNFEKKYFEKEKN